MCENGPEISEKKNAVAHSMPDGWPRKKMKFDPFGILYAGSSQYRDTICRVKLKKISLKELENKSFKREKKMKPNSM
jgi:hypothetical protein